MPWLSDLEHIRQRVGMYIGDSTTQRGLHVVLFEAIDNAMDQFLRKEASELNVEVDGNHVVVSDDGAGYPFDLRDAANASLGEQYLTSFHNKNTADDHSPHVHCVTIGCGLFCLNALTESLIVSSWRNGERWRQEFSRGVRLGPPCVIESGSGRGTIVDFVIDSQIFNGLQVDPLQLSDRLKLCSYLFPGLSIRFQQEQFCATAGLADLLRDRMTASGVPRFRSLSTSQWKEIPVFHTHSENSDFSLQVAAYGETTDETIWEAFANGARSVEEGTHRTAFEQALVDHVGWRPEIATISVIMKKPQFSGPTRTRLDMPELKDSLEAAIAPALIAYCKQNRIGRFYSE